MSHGEFIRNLFFLLLSFLVFPGLGNLAFSKFINHKSGFVNFGVSYFLGLGLFTYITFLLGLAGALSQKSIFTVGFILAIVVCKSSYLRLRDLIRETKTCVKTLIRDPFSLVLLTKIGRASCRERV